MSGRTLITSTLRMSAAAAGGQGILLLLMPFITRVYAPADFGALSVYIAITVFEVLLCLGYERAVALPKEERKGYFLLLTSVTTAAFLSFASVLLVAALRHRIADLVRIPELSWLLWLMPFSLFLIASNQAFTNWALRESDFRRLGHARVLLYAGTGVGQLALGVLGTGPAGLVVGHLIGYGVAVATLVGPVLAKYRTYGVPGFHDASELSREYRHFAIYGAPSNLLNSAGLQIPVVGIAFLFGPEIAGWYGLATRVCGIPLALVAVALGQSLKAKMAEGLRTGELATSLGGLLKTAVLVQLGLATLLLIVIAVAQPLFAFVFGSEWRVSGFYLQILAPFFLSQFVISPLHAVFDVLGLQHVNFIRESLRIVLLAATFVAAHFLGTGPVVAIALVSASGFAVYLLSGIVIFLVSRQHRLHARSGRHAADA